MLFRMAPVVVWLATFSDAKRKLADQRLKHCNINFEAESSLEIHSFLSEFEQQEGYDLGTACKVMWPSSHEVVGLALIEPHGSFRGSWTEASSWNCSLQRRLCKRR